VVVRFVPPISIVAGWRGEVCQVYLVWFVGVRWFGGVDKQIPGGSDRKKGKGAHAKGAALARVRDLR
jgi:hypothetical protein